MALSRVLFYRLAGVFAALGILVGTGLLAAHYYSQPARKANFPTVGDFALLDHQGQYHQLYQYATAKAVVLYSHGVGCQTVRNSIQTLRELHDQYAAKGVAFLLFNANSQDKREDLQKDAELLGIDMPILKDETQLVAERLKIVRTAEAIVIDPKSWAIRYRGPIDNRLPDFEAQQPKATENYLATALDAVLDGDEVDIKPSKGIGCLINVAKAEPQQAPISYSEQVVPILRGKCITCHRSGDIGPWAMDSHETIKGWSAMMREVILNKRMPPWHADPHIGEFSPDRSLSAEEQRTLVHWIDAGAPRDDKPDPLVQNPPPAAEDWPLGKPDLVLTIPKQKIPAKGDFTWRYIKLPMTLDSDKWVRAVHIKPSNRAVMHHAFAFVQYPKNLQDQQPDWAEGAKGFFGFYVPGFRVLPFPEDSGQFLPAGSAMIMQLHYVAIGYVTSDEPQVALYFHKKPPKMEYKVASAINLKLQVPPYAAAHAQTAETVMPEDGLLHSFYPHMHYRGSQFRYRAQYPDGKEEILLSIPHYSFNWQSLYQLKEAKPLPAGTKIIAEAVFDNSPQNPFNPNPAQEVKWGLRTIDEMLVGYYMYTRPRMNNKQAGISPVPFGYNQ